jgi:TRAP-type mannitol/chloroaromatic compound transport system permease large subunit
MGYRKFSWGVLKEASLNTMRVCGFIMLIAPMAVAFTGVFLGMGGGNLVGNVILLSPGGRWGAFTMIMFVVFILGFFIDWIGIIFIMIPIIQPLSPVLGFNPIWFALMICINLQMSFLTPPFATAIFYLRGVVSPEWEITINDIIRGVIPFVIIILVSLVLFTIFPELILWLPSIMIE